MKKRGLKKTPESPGTVAADTNESHVQRGHDASESGSSKGQKGPVERGIEGGYEFELNPFSGSSKGKFGLRVWRK